MFIKHMMMFVDFNENPLILADFLQKSEDVSRFPLEMFGFYQISRPFRGGGGEKLEWALG